MTRSGDLQKVYGIHVSLNLQASKPKKQQVIP